MPAETIAKFLHSAMAAASDGRVAAFPPIGPRTLVVIDEAGMVGTKDLAAVVDVSSSEEAASAWSGTTSS